MTSLTPFLLFDGNCAEAMAFYQSALGGDLTITTVADTPMRGQLPPAQHHKVAYARVQGGEYPELRAIFDKLAAGADPALLDDLRQMPFGAYGHLADRFGVHWFFQGK